MKDNKKYRDILDAGSNLLSKYGFKRVTVEEICKEANVSKMTFYKFFPNKAELTKTILDSWFEIWYGRYRVVLNSDISFAEKMKKFMEIKMEASRDRSRDFILDLYYNPDESMKQFMADFIKRGINESIDIFSYAQAKGWMRSDLKPEFLYLLTEKMSELALDEKVLSIYDDISDMVHELTMFYLYGVMDER